MYTLLLIIFGILVALPVAVFLGLHVRPRPFRAFPAPSTALPVVEVPGGLPAPVARFYQAVAGASVPVISSAVLSGRGTLRLKGLSFPTRLRFTHRAGQGYRHYIEATVFGFPLFKVNEWYLDGKARMELPVGVIENDPKTDSAANLGLWGESMFLPSLFVTDPRVQWEPINEEHARLVVPAGASTDSFTVTFDGTTGLIRNLETLRWKEPTSQALTPWRIGLGDWRRLSGQLVPTKWTLSWGDEPRPWLEATLEEAVYNADVREYIRASGP